MIWLTLLLNAGAQDTLLQQAQQLSSEGSSEQALQTLTPLLRQGDGDALSLAGTIHEQTGSLLLARQHYDSALESDALTDSGPVHLGLARCYQGTGDTGSAIQHATAAVVAASGNDGGLDEALGLLIDLSASAMGPAESMGLLAGSLSEEALIPTWVALAEGYMSREQNAAAEVPLKAAIAAGPLHPDAPQWQTRLALAARARGRVEEEVVALEVLARDYTSGTPWADAQTSEHVVDTEALVETTLRDTILRLGQDITLMPSGAAAAHSREQLARIVLVWLVRYPDHAEAGTIHGIYGRLLLELRRLEESHTQHMAAWDSTGISEHLYAAGFVADRIFMASAPAPVTQPARLSRDARQLLSAVDLYHHHFPGTEPDRTLQLKAAAAQIRLGHAADGRVRLARIIEMDSTTELAERAARMVLDSYITASDWRGVRAAAEGFAATPGLSSPGFVARLDEIMAQTASLR